MVSSEPVNILQNEINGLAIEVLHHSNPLIIHIKGKVINETMKTLVIKNTKKNIVAKQTAIFEIDIGNEKIKVKGNNLIGKPENRVKKQNKRKW